MVSVTFHGGVGEVGGNKILLESNEGRLLLDFGRSFNKEKRYYEEPFLSPRGREQMLSLGILPKIDGFYKGEAGPDVDGIFISHAHTDHYDAIRFLKDGFPVYTSRWTRELMLAREYCSRSGGERIARLTAGGSECQKDIRAFEQVKVADMDLSQIPVDHSVPGASAALVDDGEIRIAYTGDIRFHGPRANRSMEFVSRAKEMDCDLLIVEGTNMLEGKMDKESDVLSKARQVIEGSPGLIMAGFQALDLDRMSTFLALAQETDRTLAVSSKQAFALQHLRNEGLLTDYPLDKMAVFMRAKQSRYSYENALIESWPGEILNAGQVGVRQKDLMLSFTLFDMNESLEIHPLPGSAYVLSSSEPFDEEMELSYGRLCNWMTHLGIPIFQIHASGHARSFELKRMIEEISPRVVVPVHTPCPHLYAQYLRDLEVEVRLPQEGKAMEF